MQINKALLALAMGVALAACKQQEQEQAPAEDDLPADPDHDAFLAHGGQEKGNG